MIRKFLIWLLALTINGPVGFSQVRFVNNQDFELDFKQDPDLHKLEKEYDLLFVLLLDSSKQDQFYEHDPELEERFLGYSHGQNLNTSTVGFLTSDTGITQIFDAPERIMNCLFEDRSRGNMQHRISYPVYFNRNTAIVELVTTSSSDLYYIRLNKGVVQINWLGGIIE